ncbi:MAG TPA: arsenate reductase family protein [Candidatus Acidoferrum sp.]|nr:arsenate reductase family protein [Candidatus Acidoferrum sp.]
MKIRFYGYDKCSTCRNALKFLDARGIEVEPIAIRERPPSFAELKSMLASYDGDVRRLFNTSGVDYRAMKLSAKLPSMTETEALALLAKNGNLVKRPFVIRGTRGIVGFDERAWSEFFA